MEDKCYMKDENKEYFGAICCEIDKSLTTIHCKTKEDKPSTETVGWTGTCKWFKSKSELDKFIDYATKQLKYKLEK